MRDIALTVFILGSLPVILMRPHLGVLMWAWIGFMNPHRLTWGFAYDFPFAMVVGITTLMGLMISGDWRRMPWTREVIFLGLFIGWMLLTTMLALNQAEAWQEWDRVWKIQLMVLVSMMLLQRPERIRALVWVIVASIRILRCQRRAVHDFRRR